ncbi:hypothetical protein BH23DEI1_BH23DEI1_02400 [soil metagenome]
MREPESTGSTSSVADGTTIASRPTAADPQVIAGYGVGVGAVFVATLGIYWNYWQPGTSPWLWGGGSFLIGGVLGAAWAALRRARV